MVESTSSRALRQLFVTGALALACGFAVSSAALAQSTNMEGGAYWVMQRHLQQARHPIHGPHFIRINPQVHHHGNYVTHRYPKRALRHSINAGPRAPVQSASPSEAVTAAARPGVTPDFFVAVLGNGMAGSLAEGLKQAFPDKPDIAFLPQVKPVSGLVRDDYYNWPQQAAALLNGTQHLDAAVMFLGTDDHQPIRTASGYVKPDTTQWAQIYQSRVAAVMALFAAKHVPLIWVGLPIARSPRMAAAYLSFNDIYKAAASASGATYIDLWDGFEDDKGNYDDMGPDAQGNMALLRKSDGFHFTTAGANKAAQFLQASINAIYQQARPNGAAPDVAHIAPQINPSTAAPSASTVPLATPLSVPPVADVLINPAPIPDISALIGHELGKPTPISSIEARLQAALPLPQVAARPKISLGPAAGAVTALQPVAFGSDNLLGGSKKMPHQSGAAAAVFVDGLMVPQDHPGPAPAIWPKGSSQKDDAFP